MTRRQLFATLFAGFTAAILPKPVRMEDYTIDIVPGPDYVDNTVVDEMFCADSKNSYGWFCSREPGHEGPCAARNGAMWLQFKRSFKYARTDDVNYSPF